MSRALVAVPTVLLLSLASRWPIASHDVEHYRGPDEGEVVENVLEMLRMGDFDHRHRGYPGLHFYLQMAPLALHRAVEGRPIPELPRSGFYLAARRFSLLFGVATAFLAFVAGRTFLSPSAAALASALVAFSPLAARESAVVNPDLVLSFFAATSLFLSLRLLEDRRLQSFLLAGMSIGLAAAVKYTGVFCVVPFLGASFLPGLGARDARRFDFDHARRAGLGLAAAALVFVLASPYTFLHWQATLSWLGTHASYYNDPTAHAGTNGGLELLKVLLLRGLGVPAALAAAAGAALVLVQRDRHGLVVLSLPLVYLVTFAMFGRAFPRHALVLLAPLALLAGWAFDAARRTRSGARLVGVASAGAVLLLALPLWGSVELTRRAFRPTPAERAKLWAESELPAQSRVLEDQFTPALDPDRLSTHRIGVEERFFLGNYDWAFVSGYPPGIDTSALREIRRFETGRALGDTIIVYQIPARDSLMPRALAPVAGASRDIGAGELPYFGQGWHPPEAGAFETSRLSAGTSSEIFFLLPPADELFEAVRRFELELEMAFLLGPALPRSELELEIELNGRTVGSSNVGPAERETVVFPAEASHLVGGLNRLTIGYSKTERLNRRHRETAMRLYRVALTWKSRDRLR